MMELLNKYGIEPTEVLGDSGVQVLSKLRTKYCGLIEAVTTERKKTDETSGPSDLDIVTKSLVNEELTNAAQEVIGQVRDLVNEALAETPELSLVLVDLLSDVKSETISERQYVVSKNRPQKTAKRNDSVEIMKADAKELKTLIESLFKLNPIAKVKTLGKAFPLKDSKTEGIVPDLPSLPKGRTTGDSETTSGRGAIVRQLQFTWNNEALPEGTLLLDIAHDYISDRSNNYVVSFRDVSAMLKETKQEMFQATWTLEFKTGTLVCTNPTKVEKTES